MKFIILLLIVMLFGCSSKQTSKQDFSKTNFSNDYAISFKYMLPEIPSWSNFSVAGNCQRASSVRFMDYLALAKSFNLSYKQLAHFQHMFNVRISQDRERLGVLHLSRKDEEKIFQEVSNKVQGGVTIFTAPEYRRVNIIWVDPILQQENGAKKLKRLVSSKRITSGHPTFMSLCHDYMSLSKMIKENDLETMNIKMISSEFFAPFDQNIKRVNDFVLEIRALFDKQQQLHLYSPIEQMPISVFGDIELHKL